MISMACMDGLIARTALMPCCNYNNSSPTTRLLAVRGFRTSTIRVIRHTRSQTQNYPRNEIAVGNVP